MPQRVKVARGSIFDTLLFLDQIATVLAGGALWPFLESHGKFVHPYNLSGGALLQPADEAAILALEAEHSPVRHNGVQSYYFDSANNNHLRGTDIAGYSFGNATVDSPFSVGAWVMPFDIAAAHSILAKYRTSAVSAREWDFRINSSGILQVEFYDESATASEIGTGTAALTAWRWQFVCMSYDGGETSPVAVLYINGAADNAGATTETGSYVAMENTATPLLVGSRDLTASPAQEWEGRLALPFICTKALTAAEVANLYRLSRVLMAL